MFEIAGTVPISLAILVMATLGAVLLTRFWLSSSNFSSRILVAAAGGPASIFLPAILFIQESGEALIFGLIGLVIIFVVVVVVVGWPVAYVATKKLDKLTRFDPQVFE